MIDVEQWRDIYFWQDGIEYDYRGMYAISNHGNIKSLSRPIWNGYCYIESKEKILKPIKRKDGYKGIDLHKNNKKKNFLIHRLVAHMFLGDFYFKGAEIDHINTIRDDNRVENLCWCTAKDNNNNKLTKKHKSDSHMGEKNYFHGKQHTDETKKKMSRLVARYDLDMNLIDVKYMFEYRNMGFGHVSDCCNGRRKICNGFIFKHYEAEEEANGE